MSLVTKDNRISLKQFAAVPALAGLPAIMRSPPSVSNVSSFQGPEDGGIDLKEGCMVTKLVKYTHQLMHFINAVRGEDPSAVEEIIDDLAITPLEDFTLDSLCNLVFLESHIHTSLDLYAFIAITPSSSTLDKLIQMVTSDNDARQHAIDGKGVMIRRSLSFTAPCFVNSQYELVALHPEHFLPNGCPLTVYDHGTGTYKTYVAAGDRCLRETVDPSSHPLPPFHPRAVSRGVSLCSKLNVFFVALNAEIRFRRYLKMVSATPPPTPLPDHVLSLIHRTIELVRLLYWEPTPTKGSNGERVLAQQLASRRKNTESAARPGPSKGTEGGSGGELETGEEEASRVPSKRRRKFRWPADWDLEARMAYGRAMMSGHDLDYDPALFEGAFEIGDAIGTYSNTANVVAWQQSVNPEAPED
ncbi:hypothetical protein BC826DRAFT_88993 [Russula brevipes]|nr:hypothetical protein BC826DRAFT_88993 [Russula brevipes]